MNHKPIRTGAVVLSVVIIVLDQASKAMVRAVLPVWSSRSVVPGVFNLVHVQNRGAAFGFLSHAQGGWQSVFFILVAVVAAALIISLMWTGSRRDRLFHYSLGAILGGALGNLLDRIRFGTVTDFLDFYTGPHHWPAFNVADMAISSGALLLLIAVYRQGRHAPGSH